ncbi:MAG: molybdopterin molybdotransferase MoeA [Candidatus Latescibacteria bacterium]|jgi:molybdopterin molybdotransferase|nr:molybdopterin molybdotransferase MoeA [Candidatus Latescibacterota bacterium]
MSQKQNLISVTDARDTVLNSVQVLSSERLDLFASLDRVMSENVIATRLQPPWDNSAMDGYAVRSADVAAATDTSPTLLSVTEHIAAGYRSSRGIGKGEAVQIMTGAPIPEGADAVVRSEDTDQIDDSTVSIKKSVPAGKDLRRAGEDLSPGDLLLPAGTRIRPAEIGLLASNNQTYVSVHRRPRVAILSTGDEIADIGEDTYDARIIDSNSYSLTAQVLDAGATPIRLGISRDDPTELESMLRAGLSADAIITSGGVSVGEYDFVKSALGALGTTMEFWKVAMTPGRPFAFGTIQDTLAFGLPGNPVAAMVTFELFVRPALIKMSGGSKLYRPTVRAKLLGDIGKTKGRKQFLRMQLFERENQLYANPTGAQGSGILRSMSLADGLAITHEDQTLIRAGDEVEVMLLGGDSVHSFTRNC